MVKRNAWFATKKIRNAYLSIRWFLPRMCKPHQVEQTSSSATPPCAHHNPKLRCSESVQPFHPRDSKNNWKTLFTFVVRRFLFVDLWLRFIPDGRVRRIVLQFFFLSRFESTRWLSEHIVLSHVCFFRGRNAARCIQISRLGDALISVDSFLSSPR